ncbi:GNAT family N-acetyltransferase [Kitasatospora sp. NPDC088548]|uniref:GNAT family N-acetyltransferase n=1 Tax=Kitasatospora sp. NPDC088548 TaxID=3364075 RepID=UPI0038059486
MTAPHPPPHPVRPPGPADLLRGARRAAERAALGSGVTIGELHGLDAMREACDLLHRVWRPEPGNPMMTPELLLVFAHSGSYVVGVHRNGRMIGTCLGMLAAVGLHSHIAAVVDDVRGRSVGYAVKLHQRAWSLERGITTVTWTYDPLVSRNAYFNLAKLGAVPAEYLANFYGAMRDGVNAGADSDRLLVRWDLAGERAALACEGHPRTVDPAALRPPAAVALDLGPDGRPVARRLPGGARDGTVLVRVPPDIEALRQTDPKAAGEWRRALRDVLGGLMDDGRHTVTGFARDGRYLIERRQENRA